MKAHTPGPWEIAPHSDSDERLEICAGYRELGGGQSQADWIAELDAANLDGGIDTNLANAHLIIATPDLLAACRKFVDSFKSLQREKCDVAHRMALAAIAKAEGRNA